MVDEWGSDADQYDVEDAIVCPAVALNTVSLEVRPYLTIRMFPPRHLVATEVFARFAAINGFERVQEQPVEGWLPSRKRAVCTALVAKSGRITISTSKDVLFDDSVAPGAFLRDEVSGKWWDLFESTPRMVVLVGGPGPLNGSENLSTAASRRLLYGAWAITSQAT